MFLDDLYEQLDVTDDLSKGIVAALCWSALQDNQCGLNGDNREEIMERLRGDVDPYLFEVLLLSTTWSNDLCDLLEEHCCARSDEIFPKYIWPYLNGHSVHPDIRFPV